MEHQNKMAESVMRTTLSLFQEIHEAGGAIGNIQEIMNMTVHDLILKVIGPNNILFEYRKPEE